MPGVTYDTGALTAAERNDRAMWALHAGFLAQEVVPTVPASVLAEAWRGGRRQASLVRFLALCAIEELGEAQCDQDETQPPPDSRGGVAGAGPVVVAPPEQRAQ